MKKVLLLAIFSSVFASLAFGDYYEDLATKCLVNQDEASCDILKNSCRKGNGEACFRIGLNAMVMSEYLSEQNAHKEAQEALSVALDMFEFGCRQPEQSYKPCKIYVNLLEEDCNIKNDIEACNGLFNVYSSVYYGEFKDDKKALSYSEKICNFSNPSQNSTIALGCRNTALSYYKGEGVKKNLSKAKKYAQKACKLYKADGTDIFGACDLYKEIIKESGGK